MVDGTAFREAIGHFATGVTVITTLHEDKPAGMTASAVASLSLDPVLLLVCIAHRLPTHHAIDSARGFVVNVLGEGQEELALALRATGDRTSSPESRCAPNCRLPVLDDAIAYFVCDVHERFPGGDHSDLHRASCASATRRPAGGHWSTSAAASARSATPTQSSCRRRSAGTCPRSPAPLRRAGRASLGHRLPRDEALPEFVVSSVRCHPLASRRPGPTPAPTASGHAGRRGEPPDRAGDPPPPRAQRPSPRRPPRHRAGAGTRVRRQPAHDSRGAPRARELAPDPRVAWASAAASSSPARRARA